MIFIHWGYLFEDAMDLDPDIRKTFVRDLGTDYAKWSGHIAQPGSRPAKAFGIRPGDYVLAKAAQDAFRSCNIAFVLRNLEIKNIVFVGGHTEACLGKTAKSAKAQGYATLCISDATSNARESTRPKRNCRKRVRFCHDHRRVPGSRGTYARRARRRRPVRRQSSGRTGHGPSF